jgi:hypothetical protein
MTDHTDIIEWFITILAITGALLMSFNIPQAFFVYLVTESLAIYYFKKKGLTKIMIVYCVFLLTSLNGIYTFFIK